MLFRNLFFNINYINVENMNIYLELGIVIRRKCCDRNSEYILRFRDYVIERIGINSS